MYIHPISIIARLLWSLTSRGSGLPSPSKEKGNELLKLKTSNCSPLHSLQFCTVAAQHPIYISHPYNIIIIIMFVYIIKYDLYYIYFRGAKILCSQTPPTTCGLSKHNLGPMTCRHQTESVIRGY